MCGRATLVTSPAELAEIFDLEDVPDLPPRFNIAPSQPLPVIREPGRLELLTWGAPGRKFINVRVESATVNPTKRCLVVLDGFYEWRREDRQPFYFRRLDRKPFAVGGVITGGDACVIATCPAGTGIVDIHDRMPVVLSASDWSGWLAGEKPPASLSEFERYPVSRLVNAPKNEDPRCIEPAPEQPLQQSLLAPDRVTPRSGH